MQLNSDAIYSTRPWKIHGEGPTNGPAKSMYQSALPSYIPRDFGLRQRGHTVRGLLEKSEDFTSFPSEVELSGASRFYEIQYDFHRQNFDLRIINTLPFA
jgi:hypothetical protein